MPLIQIYKTNQNVLKIRREQPIQFHAKWSLQYFNMYYEISKKCASFENRIQHLFLSIIFIINSMQHIFTEQQHNQIAKECTPKWFYYLLPSTLLLFTLVHISYLTQLLSALMNFNRLLSCLSENGHFL